MFPLQTHAKKDSISIAFLGPAGEVDLLTFLSQDKNPKGHPQKASKIYLLVLAYFCVGLASFDGGDVCGQ